MTCQRKRRYISDRQRLASSWLCWLAGWAVGDAYLDCVDFVGVIKLFNLFQKADETMDKCMDSECVARRAYS